MRRVKRRLAIIRFRARQQRRRAWCRLRHPSHDRIREVDRIAFPQGPSGKPRIAAYHFECRRCGWPLK